MSELNNAISSSGGSITGSSQVGSGPVTVFAASVTPAASDVVVNLRLTNAGGTVLWTIKAAANGPTATVPFPNGLKFGTFLYVEFVSGAGAGVSANIAYVP